MKHRIVMIDCPDKMCKPNRLQAELHFFSIYNHFLRRTEKFFTLICSNHQRPYAQMSGTTFWSSELVEALCKYFDEGNGYKKCTDMINEKFKTNFTIQERENNKGWRGHVVKKIEHLREMSVHWQDEQDDDTLKKLYYDSCQSANLDHKKRTDYWNQYRKGGTNA